MGEATLRWVSGGCRVLTSIYFNVWDLGNILFGACIAYILKVIWRENEQLNVNGCFLIKDLSWKITHFTYVQTSHFYPPNFGFKK